MKRPVQGMRQERGSLLDPRAKWRDWNKYRITNVKTDTTPFQFDLVSSVPGQYASLSNVLYTDWLYIHETYRNGAIDNTLPTDLKNFADAVDAYDLRQDQRILRAVINDDRVAFKRAQAPESFIIFNDARDELSRLRRHMCRDSIPERFEVGNTVEQRVPRIRQIIKDAQNMPGDITIRDAYIRRLEVTEKRLVQDWNRLLELAKFISTSEWVRDSELWGPLYNPNNNDEIEATLFHIMTSFTPVVSGTCVLPAGRPTRSVRHKIAH